jgi:Yip1 domain
VNLTLQSLVGLTQLTLSDPRRAARSVIGMDLPMPIIWIGVALTSVLAALLVHVSMVFLPPEDAAFATMFPGPFQTAALQFGMMVLTAALATQIGQMRGGRGRFAEALMLMVWLQAVMLLAQLAQIVALVILSSSLSALLGLAGIALFLWLLTNFIAELHGFASLGGVFLGVVGAGFGVILALSLILAPFYPMGV